ncbi:hypothetical protein D9758_017581 [Tetrapyrgos nigripes]|uniref:MCM C-terminal AAA(+) ATPase domain-containing protein n=1 Tax=Tetrapyrgos nigripes TaxID=182062 RepID=A0A8H5FJH7_9AGAR|nr:hypothetical protein D9758_017581 [Tetrapyrgos nigripes]
MCPPRGVYTSDKGSSAVGLNGVCDEGSGFEAIGFGRRVGFGALVLSNGGGECCIDELNANDRQCWVEKEWSASRSGQSHPAWQRNGNGSHFGGASCVVQRFTSLC